MLIIHNNGLRDDLFTHVQCSFILSTLSASLTPSLFCCSLPSPPLIVFVLSGPFSVTQLFLITLLTRGGDVCKSVDNLEITTLLKKMPRSLSVTFICQQIPIVVLRWSADAGLLQTAMTAEGSGGMARSCLHGSVPQNSTSSSCSHVLSASLSRWLLSLGRSSSCLGHREGGNPRDGA